MLHHRIGTLLIAIGLSAAAGCEPAAGALPPPTQATAPAATATAPAPPAAPPGAGVEVLLCDGQTRTVVPPGTPGTSVAGALMSEWLRKNPSSTWDAEERERHTLQPAADNSALVGQVQGQTYGQVTARDVALWKAETERVAVAGSAV